MVGSSFRGDYQKLGDMFFGVSAVVVLVFWKAIAFCAQSFELYLQPYHCLLLLQEFADCQQSL
jgi:hypothetical protein